MSRNKGMTVRVGEPATAVIDSQSKNSAASEGNAPYEYQSQVQLITIGTQPTE